MILFQNSLWFSNFKGTIFELDLTTFEVNKLMELQQLFLMKSYTNNVLLSDLNQSSDLSTHLPVDLIPAYGHFSKFGNVYYGVLYSRLMIWNKESIPTEIHTNLARSYTYFTKNLNGDLYLGRSHGLFKVNIKDSTFSEEKLLSYPTTCLLPYKDGYFIGTKGNGVFYVDSSNSTVLGKPKIDGEYVEHLSLKKDTLIVVTNTGINLIVQNSKESDNQKLFHLGLSDGLASLAIKSIVIHREYLYLASDKGLQRIKLSHITKPKPNPIPIIERLNSHKIRTKQLYTLGPGTKNIRVELNTVDFNSIGDQNLEYRLLGQSDSTWQNSSAKTLEFINLQPGSYQLEVRSKYADNGPTITNVQFKLLPVFYQPTAFKVVLIVFTLLLALGIYMYEQQRIRKKNEAIVLLEQLRFKALTAQLNPHFIFNVLNSIQALILTDQNDQAAENLAEFSDLISKTLMNTNEMFIPLNDEIDFINQYVKVERSRFEHDIEFEWKIDSTITPRMVMVPTMFLQPYIENAIVHGLKNISYTGKIRVKIQKLPTRDFKVFIEDNGIGLRAALKRKNKNRRPSLAMKNLNERFNTLERMFNHKFSHTIEEITDNNVVKGTLVQITIPYKVKEI
jgi:two-component sensor histidine kinase